MILYSGRGLGYRFLRGVTADKGSIIKAIVAAEVTGSSPGHVFRFVSDINCYRSRGSWIHQFPRYVGQHWAQDEGPRENPQR